jgi:hypothetical protein
MHETGIDPLHIPPNIRCSGRGYATVSRGPKPGSDRVSKTRLPKTATPLSFLVSWSYLARQSLTFNLSL